LSGEFAFIEQIRKGAQRGAASGEVRIGIGDDAAALRQHADRETLVTVDLLIEGIDFQLSYVVPAWLGHKALAVSLSDIAAMGGTAHSSLLTLGIPAALIPRGENDLAGQFWEGFFAGYFALGEQAGVTLIGGDISASPGPLTLDSIVLGQCQAGQAIERKGARPGQALFVTGTLGASAVGLRLLSAGARPDPALLEAGLIDQAIAAHLRPLPRVAFGQALGRHRLAHAMIDLSDGLLQDLGHLCEESRVTAMLDYAAIPLSPCLSLLPIGEEERFVLGVSGGEDFELLFTADADQRTETRLRALAESCGHTVARIGQILPATSGEGPVCVQKDGAVIPLTLGGYDHFQERRES
jgi:thiamine-monophosphate kinase